MKPNVNVEEMKNFYEFNENFRNYVDRYCKKHQIDKSMAMEHMLVKYAFIEYYEKAKEPQIKNPVIEKEKIFDEDKAC